MVMKNNRTFPQRGRADGGVRQSVLNVTGREAWNKCWINSLNRVFIAVLCHFSVTTQDSNVLFVLKFTRFNKNSRYWMFFPIFFSIWRNIHWFPVRCQRFQHRRFDCVDPNVSPGTYELGRNRICWPRISSTFLYLMYISFLFLWVCEVVTVFRHKHHVVQVMFCWTTRGVITTNRAGSVPDVVPHSCLPVRYIRWIYVNVNVFYQQIVLETRLLLGLHLNPPCAVWRARVQ